MVHLYFAAKQPAIIVMDLPADLVELAQLSGCASESVAVYSRLFALTRNADTMVSCWAGGGFFPDFSWFFFFPFFFFFFPFPFLRLFFSP